MKRPSASGRKALAFYRAEIADAADNNKARKRAALSVIDDVLAPPRKPGRPPRADKASLERVEIRVTKAELLVWKRCAKNSSMTLSEWLRWCAANFAPDA